VIRRRLDFPSTCTNLLMETEQSMKNTFELIASGIVTYHTDSKLFFEFAKEVTTFAERDGFSASLVAIVFFPIICDPAVFRRPDYIRYKRDGSAFIGRNIDFSLWRSARRKTQKELAKNLVADGILAIGDHKLPPVDKLMLLVYLDMAGRALGLEHS
jgi:hypothetical protein